MTELEIQVSIMSSNLIGGQIHAIDICLGELKRLAEPTPASEKRRGQLIRRRAVMQAEMAKRAAEAGVVELPGTTVVEAA